MSSHSVITVIGKDRIGIVYDVSKLLAENQINILNISQQLMDDYFTMIIFGRHSQMPEIAAGNAGRFRTGGKNACAGHPYAGRRAV